MLDWLKLGVFMYVLFFFKSVYCLYFLLLKALILKHLSGFSLKNMSMGRVNNTFVKV